MTNTRKKLVKEDKAEVKTEEVAVNATVSLAEDDSFDNSFYKGKGGCYTFDEQGRRVPVTDKGENKDGNSI